MQQSLLNSTGKTVFCSTTRTFNPVEVKRESLWLHETAQPNNMCSGHKIVTFPASSHLKHVKPDLALFPPRAISLTSAYFTPLVSFGLGLCVFWMKHFDLLFLAYLCKTQSVSMSNVPLTSYFCLPVSHPECHCACGSPETCFQGTCLEKHLHCYNTAAHSTLQTPHHPIFFGFIWWKVRLVWLGVWLVGFLVCLFLALILIVVVVWLVCFFILCSANEEEQRKLWKTSERRTSAQTVPSAIAYL